MSTETTPPKADPRPAELDSAFDPWQVALLKQPVPPKLLHRRTQGGTVLEYPEDGFVPRRRPRVTVATILLRGERQENGCLLWQGATDKDGYGRVFFRGRQRHAHSVICEAACGHLLTRGLVACHSCDTPSCIEPSHLFPGTVLDNNRDAKMKGRHRAPVCPTERKARGEAVGGARLEAAQVLVIKERLARGDTQRAIATDYGVHFATVNLIAVGRNWKHVRAGDGHAI